MNNPWGSYSHYLMEGDLAPFVTETRLPDESPTRLIHTRQPAGEHPDPATPDVPLQLCLTPVAGEFDLNCGRFEVGAKAGGVCVAPPDCDCDYRLFSSFELLVLPIPGYIAKAALEDVSVANDFGPLHSSFHFDLGLSSPILRLWAEAQDDSPMGLLMVDDVLVALAGRLARLSAGHELTAVAPLSGPKLRRVLDRIGDCLHEPLRQSDLSQAAGLSAWHFCRAFQAAVGVSPHQYVMKRRVAKAIELLKGTPLRAIEIATDCGFTDVAHLTKMIRRATGRTPANLRMR